MYSVVVNLRTTCQQYTKEFLYEKGFDLWLVGNASQHRVRIKPQTLFVLTEDSHINCVANLDHFPDASILSIMNNPEIISLQIELKER